MCVSYCVSGCLDVCMRMKVEHILKFAFSFVFHVMARSASFFYINLFADPFDMYFIFRAVFFGVGWGRGWFCLCLFFFLLSMWVTCGWVPSIMFVHLFGRWSDCLEVEIIFIVLFISETFWFQSFSCTLKPGGVFRSLRLVLWADQPLLQVVAGGGSGGQVTRIPTGDQRHSRYYKHRNWFHNAVLCQQYFANLFLAV